MTTPPKPRAGRRAFDDGRPNLIEWLDQISDICGMCFGHREYRCPECAGLDGCPICGYRKTVACRQCSHGHLEPWN